jgi:hypothetical protein
MTAMRENDKEKQLAIYRRIIADFPHSQSAKSAEAQIRQAEGIGKPFDLAFTDAITEKPISMKELQGKVVVIDFWLTVQASIGILLPRAALIRPGFIRENPCFICG